jgi:hypothetical protein
MKIFIFALFLISSSPSFAKDGLVTPIIKKVEEQEAEHDEKKEEAEFTGVPIFLDNFEIFPERWTAQIISDIPFYFFYLGAPRFDGLAFLPNSNPDLGVSLGYRGWALRLTQPVKVLRDYEVQRRGSSSKQEFILGISWHQFAIDFNYQYYRGFYLDTPVSGVASEQPARYSQLPDTQVHSGGFNVYYVVQPEKYSIGAAFSHDEYQFKSGGSPLLNGYISYLNMNPGLAFIPGSASEVQQRPSITAGTFWSPGISGGYGYTYSYKRYYATVQGFAGIGPQFQQLEQAAGSYNRLNLQLKLNGAFAVGLNRRYDFAGLQALLDSVYAEIENGQLASTLFSAVFFYGVRF